jgi:hypothetical protein
VNTVAESPLCVSERTKTLPKVNGGTIKVDGTNIRGRVQQVVLCSRDDRNLRDLG